MPIDKGLLTGGTTMMVLKLLESRDLYGYAMIEQLAKLSDDTFNLKAGTLYPILHGLEKSGCVSSYDKQADSARVRKYYHLTKKGHELLMEKQSEWNVYANAVNRVLQGGECFASAI